jgi:hypothetical protein
MKVIGIDIAGRDVRIIALEEQEDRSITNYTGKYKPIRLEDDDNAANVILFKATLFATIQSFSPEVIIINYRDSNASGKYSPSSISFKIEGLIQLYDNASICFTKPQTLAAFYKRNNLEITTEYVYQKDALRLAYHYLKTKN